MTISAVSVLVDISHEYMGDIFFYLESPAGTEAILYDRSGGWEDDLSALFPRDMVPVDSLTAYSGEDAFGTWTLHVSDVASSISGTLDGWRLYVE